ncbi:DUF6610 family protein [Cronobacter dublinensis]|uniref:DUF6610 family protein n=1 Tax=Cronobacter dublinensis TaxID=413497 RepID=UPI0024AF6126|nr:DUF6610 family protein [Cronobacter dublinensis]MDI7384248.1 hypothetical protein [Cronobacter dublinensis]
MIYKFVTHSQKVLNISIKHGWYPGARYTNLRNLKGIDFENQGFIDIDWKNYNFEKHLAAVKEKKPFLTIARDVENIFELDSILKQAEILKEHSLHVAIVPKDVCMNNRLTQLVPKEFILGYSVPTKYGGTKVSIDSFDREVHLLGGRPDVQRRLANYMNVLSLDCNRFTLDAGFGYFFNGEKFIKNNAYGYDICLEESVKNINNLWVDYKNLNLSQN